MPTSAANAPPPWSYEFALRGPGGEPIDLWRTFISHGIASLPPMALDEGARTLEITLPLQSGAARTVKITEPRPGHGLATMSGRAPGVAARQQIVAQVRHVLRLDHDLSQFYDLAASDRDLAWVGSGAGRMIQSPTVFEEVVKTICTTNCSWAATTRMVSALIENLGERAPGGPADGPGGRAFPTPEAMASMTESFYRDVVRAGYRSAYLQQLARDVAAGAVDLEALGRASRDELSDDELGARLLALPGVGPYAAAHTMMLMGRYSRLILDSWTRPKYARLVGRKKVADGTITRRFKRYGAYAGLAFWLFLTRDWGEEGVV